jgi:3-hydroxybutyryl-CoA dehydrogenase
MTGIRTIGVIGAGQMGNGIAHVCALAGFDVMLNDVSADRLEAGIKTIQRNMDRQVHRQMISAEQRDAGMRRSDPRDQHLVDLDHPPGAATDRPERFIGLHFMNPVPLMKLVELIRGIATDQLRPTTPPQFVTALGKTTTNAEDFPAFIVNRVLMPMINEAIYTLYEGVGTVERSTPR